MRTLSAANDIYEQARLADFNRTEPETLSQLVDNAIKIGDEIKGDYIRLRQITDDVLELLRRKDLLRLREFNQDEILSVRSSIASASDGSFQSMGGASGIWYVPISVSLIAFCEGINKPPKVKVGARILKIDEREHANLGAAMETSMLYAESTILKDWALECPRKIIHFIDGPVIDPPRQMEKKYTEYRIGAIKNCLSKEVFVLGCVKKLLGNFLMERLSNMVRKLDKERMFQFASDGYLIYHVFTKASLQSGKTVYTKPLEILETNPLYKQYRNQGLKVYFMYFQREPRSKPFRVDIPIGYETDVDEEQLGQQAAIALSAWSYPGYDLPLPIVIAHDKCNIRRGCAEVLYSEIITRAAGNDLFDNVVRTKLGTEVA